jgi:hypothetical protein
MERDESEGHYTTFNTYARKYVGIDVEKRWREWLSLKIS